jgi:hypothetical protein
LRINDDASDDVSDYVGASNGANDDISDYVGASDGASNDANDGCWWFP